MTIELAELILVGVASGILTSATLFVGGLMIRRIVLPWYRDLIYNGIHVAGEWHSMVAPFDQHIKLELSQRAHALTGFAIYVNSIEDESTLEKTRSFRVTGSIRDRFIQLSLTHTDPSRIGVVTYILEVVGDGRKMLGAAAYYDLEAMRVSHSEISFTRYTAASKPRQAGTVLEGS